MIAQNLDSRQSMVEELASALQERIEVKQLRAILDHSVEQMVASTEAKGDLYARQVRNDQVARLLVIIEGIDVLRHKDLRTALIRKATDEQIDQLYHYDSSAPPRYGRPPKERAIAARNWHPGKSWPRFFTRILNLPIALAGVTGVAAGPAYEDIEPHVRLGPLHNYQQQLLDKTLRFLHKDPPGRAILTLPTGAGKTRTAVEALLEWWAHTLERQGYILWIAAHDELCEQAIGAFRDVWVDWGLRCAERSILRLHRLWDNRPLPEVVGGGVVVASIQKLNALLDDEGEEAREFDDFVSMTRAIVIDEAHHALAPSYMRLLRRFGLSRRSKERPSVPLLGLTATPYRGWSQEENQELAQLFGKQLIRPTLRGDDPIHALREKGILSSVSHEVLSSGRTFALSMNEVQQLEQFNQFPPTFLQRVAADRDRNRLLLKCLLQLEPTRSILFFGCSLPHATAIAALLERKGRSSALISGKTRPAMRRQLIEEFRQGQIQVLCNYGVLTTGFDAPAVDVVVIARPTASPVLYEQMIGRGMRGPVNGGTEHCQIIDIADNIQHFSGQLAHERFSDFWR